MASVSTQSIYKFQNTLLEWYKLNGRNFPWRKNGLTQYEIIIAEILLQRTKAETVAAFYPTFLKTFPNWLALKNADSSTLENTIKPIGLYKQRSKRLKELANEMVKRGGKLPRDLSELEKIPFFGQYIINAIILQVFKEPAPLIDVNMARVLERYFMERKLADIRYDPFLQNLAWKVVDNSEAKKLNWAILDYAALVCKARKPSCLNCSLKSTCTYFKHC